MSVLREREVKKLMKRLSNHVKPNESVFDAILRIENKIEDTKCEIDDLEDELSCAQSKLEDLNDIKDDLIELQGLTDIEPVPAKRKERKADKKLSMF